MKHLYKLIFAAVIATGQGCAIPNSGYFAMSPSEAEANRRNTERIEREGNDEENRNLMNRAAATEVATRHAPTSVSTTQIYAPHNY